MQASKLDEFEIQVGEAIAKLATVPTVNKEMKINFIVSCYSKQTTKLQRYKHGVPFSTEAMNC